MATKPKLVGLKRCLPRKRSTNLLAMVRIAAATASAGALVRSRRQTDRPEISALRGS